MEGRFVCVLCVWLVCSLCCGCYVILQNDSIFPGSLQELDFEREMAETAALASAGGGLAQVPHSSFLH